MSDSESNNAAVIIEAARQCFQPIQVPGRVPVVAVPQGFELQELMEQPVRQLPDHIRQVVTLEDRASFLKYVADFKTPQTAVFFSANAFLAVIDYHDKETEPAHCAHRVHYPMPHSVEWKKWAEKHKKSMTQEQFIEFLDEQMPDILSPAGADLRELAMDFESKSEVRFTSKINRTNGGRVLNFTDSPEVNSRPGQIPVPEALWIDIPIYHNADPSKVEVRILWKVKDYSLSITLEIVRMERLIQDAQAAIVQSVTDALGVPVLFGKPTLPEVYGV